MKKKKISIKKITEKLSGGFTFVETLAVIAVSSVLACQVSISSMKLVQKGKIAAAKGQIECFRGALQSFYIDCGKFPSEVQGLRFGNVQTKGIAADGTDLTLKKKPGLIPGEMLINILNGTVQECRWSALKEFPLP